MQLGNLQVSAGRLNAAVRIGIGLLLPFVAFALQLLVVGREDPVYFVGMFPAIFLSAWIGGPVVGLLATAIATLLVLVFLIPPYGLFLPTTTRQWFSLLMFVASGALLSMLQWKLSLNAAGARMVESLRALAAELRESEERWKFALEGAAQGVWDWDVPSGAVYYSPAYRSMMGYAEGDPFPATAEFGYSNIHPDDLAHVSAELGRALRGETSIFDIEYRVRRKDGRYIWVQGRGMIADRAPDGSALRLIGTHTDATQRIADTRALALARDAAEQASRAKTAFLATMSHELRTPLNAVIGFSDVLLSGAPGPLNDEQRKQLEIIHGAGRQQLALVQEILDHSRIEAGRLELRPQAMEVAPLLEETLDYLRPDAAQRGLALAVTQCTAGLAVRADPQRLRQVLRNLVDNAIKFTDAGTIEVRAASLDGVARVEVRDSGIGIPAYAHGRLFDAFERVEVNGRTASGTGLGLAISRRLVEAMGGDIGIESTPGHGSTFWFTVPLASAAPAGADARADA